MPPTLRGLLTLLRELIRGRPDVAHLHGIGHPMIDIAAFLCQRFRISYIVVCHGLPLSSNPHNLFLRLFYRAYERLISLRTLRDAVFIVAISNRVASGLKRMGVRPEKIRVTYHIPLREKTQAAGSSFREVAKISSDKKIILFLGSISYRKGADLALKTALDLRVLRSDFAFCFVGPDGGMIQEARRKTRELNLDQYVKILGYVNSSVRNSALEACDLVFFPSRDEPYGLVPLEALFHGKPVLVSTNSGVAELLKNSGLLFDPEQTKLAAQKVNEILDAPELAKYLVRTASKVIESIPVEETTIEYEELSTKSRVKAS
jgi:glycosyltransferase involved in cell wall biosynthesis